MKILRSIRILQYITNILIINSKFKKENKMGGCISPPHTKKSKIPKPESYKSKPTPQDAVNLTIDNGYQPLINGTNAKNTNRKIDQPAAQPPKPKFKKITGQQFCRIYRIEDNVGITTRAEGPKYISNYADGTGRVLRVVPFGVQSNVLSLSTKDMDSEKRVKAYAQNLGLQVYEDEESNLLVMQQYYCGPFLHQLVSKDDNIEGKRQQIRRFLSQIYQIIESFHQKNIILGNISIFSFRQASQFDSTVKLIDLNLCGNLDEGMGHAFKAEKSMDWEAFAFIVQLVVGQQPPIFVPHKIQYIENSNNVVHSLLRGKKIKREEIDNLNYCIPNENTVIGYKFRSDINKLLKLRKRRMMHRAYYYSQDFMANGDKMADDAIQRIETTKIFDRIENYIGGLNPQCEQAFTMYSTPNDSLKKLKVIFAMKEQDKKMEQLKQTLPLIK